MLIACMILLYNTKAQNLIQNGSLENYTSIDCTYGAFDNATVFPAVHVVDNWYTLNSSDYYNNVCNSSVYNVPYSWFGNSYAKQGNAFAGFICFTGNYNTKEYIYQHLTNPLQGGKTYCLTFYVTRADKITHAIHSIGAYFSVSTPTLFSSYYVNATPQVLNQNGFVTDTISWTEIQGCFTATGGEQYITLGNFNSNANTDTLYVGTTDPMLGADRYAYYYIDDISLVEDLSTGINEINGYNISILPNPTSSILNIGLSTIPENTSINIINSLGQVVIYKSLNEQKSVLSIENLQGGIYYYQISVNGKSIKNDKIIVIK
jgi:hypothetical protein